MNIPKSVSSIAVENDNDLAPKHRVVAAFRASIIFDAMLEQVELVFAQETCLARRLVATIGNSPESSVNSRVVNRPL